MLEKYKGSELALCHALAVEYGFDVDQPPEATMEVASHAAASSSEAAREPRPVRGSERRAQTETATGHAEGGHASADTHQPNQQPVHKKRRTRRSHRGFVPAGPSSINHRFPRSTAADAVRQGIGAKSARSGPRRGEGSARETTVLPMTQTQCHLWTTTVIHSHCLPRLHLTE